MTDLPLGDTPSTCTGATSIWQTAANLAAPVAIQMRGVLRDCFAVG